MILDIVQVQNGKDLGFAQSNLPKAANVLAVQVGELEYADTFGIDKKYFLTTEVNFQPENFKAHVVQRLAENQISVTEVLKFLQALSGKFTFKIGNETENVKGLIK